MAACTPSGVYCIHIGCELQWEADGKFKQLPPGVLNYLLVCWQTNLIIVNNKLKMQMIEK